MKAEDKTRCNRLLDNWCKEFNNDMLAVHYQIKTNILQNKWQRFSNDFICMMWNEWNKRYNEIHYENKVI